MPEVKIIQSAKFTGPDGGFTSQWTCNCSTRTILDK